MYNITRKHEIHCGHRLVNHEGACCNLHGHSYVFHLTCASEGLDEVGRVIDFSIIKKLLCSWLDKNWDHKMILWEEDPWLTKLKEIDNSIVTIPYNPTAENMAMYLVKVIGPQLLHKLNVVLTKVVVEETSKCNASYFLSN